MRQRPSTDRRTPSGVVVSGCALLCACLAACTSDDGRARRTEAPSRSASAAPTSTVPWAEALESAYRDATSEFEREVLEDGEITEAEFHEMERRVKSCLNDNGIEFRGFQPDGSMEYRVPPSIPLEVGNELMRDCVASSGSTTIGLLYHEMRRNPRNEPAEAR